LLTNVTHSRLKTEEKKILMLLRVAIEKEVKHSTLNIEDQLTLNSHDQLVFTSFLKQSGVRFTHKKEKIMKI
jgi:hypothetical protein